MSVKRQESRKRGRGGYSRPRTTNHERPKGHRRDRERDSEEKRSEEVKETQMIAAAATVGNSDGCTKQQNRFLPPRHRPIVRIGRGKRLKGGMVRMEGKGRGRCM